MKRIVKIVGIVLLSIIGIYTLFVVEESIRIANDVEAKPVIVFLKSDNNKSSGNEIVYSSLGFKLVNKYGLESSMVGQEFWLFDTFLLWGWIS